MHSAIIEKLYNDYKLHGYITEQSVFKMVEENDVPLFDIEYICDQLLSKGVIIRDDDPDEEDDDYDRSSTDYSKIYSANPSPVFGLISAVLINCTSPNLSCIIFSNCPNAFPIRCEECGRARLSVSGSDSFPTARQ